MTTANVESLVHNLCQSGLLDAAQMDKLTRQLQFRFADPQALADDLIRRGWLTPQQIYPLLQGSLPYAMAAGQRKEASRRRWLTFNIVGGLMIVVLTAVIFYVLRQDRLKARDHAEAMRLAALEEHALADLKPLIDGFERSSMDDDQLRKNLVGFRNRYAEVPAALKAAELLARLPSPLDALDHGHIAKADILPGQPENLIAVLGERLWRHWGAVRTVALSDALAASGGEDGFVRLWDRKSSKEIAALPVANAVALSFLPGAKMIACASGDGNVSLWEVETGKKYGDYPGPAKKVVAAAFTRDGDVPLAASVQDDGAVRVWELQTGKERGSLRGNKGAVHCVAFSPDTLTIATGGADGAVILWRQSGEPRASLTEHQDAVKSVAFSPDGKLLASGGADRDCNVIIWDLAKGESTATLEGHTAPVNALAFTADQKHIVSGSSDQTIRIWEVRKKPEPKPAVPPAPNPDQINNQEKADNQNNNDLNNQAKTPPPPSPPLLAVFKLTGHVGPVLGLTIFGEGEAQTIASAGGDGTVRLWSVSGRAEITSLRDHAGPISSVTFLDDPRHLATGGYDKTVKIWDVESRVLRSTLTGHTAAVSSLSYSPAERILASGSHDNSVRLWDPMTSKELGTLAGHVGPVMSVAFALDGKTLAVGASAGDEQPGQLKLWNPATRNERTTLLGHKDVVAAVAFAPDGRTLASGSGDGTIRLWEPFLGLQRGVLDDKAFIMALAISPDSKTLASADYGKTVRLWNVTAREERTSYPGQSAACKALAYSLDGKLLAALQEDGKVIVWNTANGDKKEWHLPGPAGGIAFAPDSRHLATANFNGTIYILRVADIPKRIRK
jgi:WD40 repeat protein